MVAVAMNVLTSSPDQEFGDRTGSAPLPMAGSESQVVPLTQVIS